MKSKSEPPEWHQKELRKRAVRIREEKVNYTSLSKLKERGLKISPLF